MNRVVVLATVQSDRDPNKAHRICLDKHNLVFCTCKAWRFQGHCCKHLTAFRAMLTTKQVA